MNFDLFCHLNVIVAIGETFLSLSLRRSLSITSFFLLLHASYAWQCKKHSRLCVQLIETMDDDIPGELRN